jgi:antitoxin component of MazEF toxin-antitoxin module
LKISECTFTVSGNGSLKIPAAILRNMGLGPGSHVRVAYLTPDGQKNVFQEFVLSADPLDSLSEEQPLRVPDQLLEQANLPTDADLQIFCLSGCILICRDLTLNQDELYAVLDQLRTAEELMSILPSDGKQPQIPLCEMITDLLEGGHTGDEECQS